AGRAPAQRAAVGRAALAVGDVADVHVAATHARHIGGEVVALPRDVAHPAGGEESGRPPAGGAPVLVGVAHAEDLEVVLAVEGDGVVGAAAGVDATRLHVEAEPAVEVDAALEGG